jgi:hypothetical protein
MRNYWLRILLGAVAIFTVGMVGVTLARHGMSRVRGVVEGSGPISLPVAFLPFKLDGERIGTIQRIKILRNAPNQVRSVHLQVKLADSVRPSRLVPCILVAQGFNNIDSETTVLCSNAEDTVGEDLAGVGDISLSGSTRSFRLFMPRDDIRELTDSDVVFVGEDSADALARQGDSIARATERMTDSILEAKRPQLESLGVNVPRRPTIPRKVKAPVADSIRRR